MDAVRRSDRDQFTLVWVIKFVWAEDKMRAERSTKTPKIYVRKSKKVVIYVVIVTQKSQKIDTILSKIRPPCLIFFSFFFSKGGRNIMV